MYKRQPYYQNLTETFTPLGVKINAGEYSYSRHAIYWSTDGSKKVSVRWNGEYGNYFNGKLNTTDFTLQLAPIPHISMISRFNRNRFIEVGENKITKTIDLWSIESRLALNPKMCIRDRSYAAHYQ